jgi:adenylate cyclase
MRYRALTLTIGIHSGTAVFVPIIGSQFNLLTPLGEVANVTAILESANQAQKTQLLISEDTYQSIKDKAVIGKKVTWNDKKLTLPAYEVLAMQGIAPIIENIEPPPARQRLLTFVKKFAGSWLKSS